MLRRKAPASVRGTSIADSRLLGVQGSAVCVLDPVAVIVALCMGSATDNPWQELLLNACCDVITPDGISGV